MLEKILHTFFSKAFIGVANLVVVILTTHYLGPEGRGTTSLILSCIAINLVLCNIGGGPVLVYMAPRFSIQQLTLVATLWSLGMAGVSTIILAFTPLLETAYLIHIFVLSFLNALFTNCMMILTGKENVNAGQLLNVLVAMVTLLVMVLFLLDPGGRNPMAYVKALYAGYGSATLVGFFMIRKFLSTGQTNIQPIGMKEIFTKMIRYGWMVQIGAVFTFLVYRSSYFFMEHYHGRAGLGIFSVGVTISEAVWIVGGSIGLNFFSRVANSKEQQKMATEAIHYGKLAFLITLCVVGIMALLPVTFYQFVFGAEFGDVKTVFLSLAPGVLVFSVNAVINHFFSGTAQYWVCTFSSLSGFLVALAGNFLLVPSFGMVGAGLASSAAYIVMTAFQYITLTKNYQLDWKNFFSLRLK